MKIWKFKVKDNVQEISKKLGATLGSADGFVFNLDTDKSDSVAFKVHKRGLYAFYLMFLNKVIVHGKILKSDTEDETALELTFTQYFLWKLVIYTHLLLGLAFLIAIISGINSSTPMYILGGILLALGIILWIAVEKKFEKDIQEYKTLISEILAA